MAKRGCRGHRDATDTDTAIPARTPAPSSVMRDGPDSIVLRLRTRLYRCSLLPGSAKALAVSSKPCMFFYKYLVLLPSNRSVRCIGAVGRRVTEANVATGMKTLLKAVLATLSMGMLSACTVDELIVDSDWVPKRIVGHISHLKKGEYGPKRSTVVFRNGRNLKVDIIDLKFIGQLTARGKAPYIIFSGRRCFDCESNYSIYIHSPGDGRLTRETKRYRYPGRVYSHVNGSLVEESRAFFGDCLPGYSAATVVWFLRTRLDRPNWVSQVELVESAGVVLNERRLDDPTPAIDATLKLVEEERCREIPGLQMSTEP